MTTRLSPYPKYRNSRVPWVGDIPSHWGTKPLKHWVRINGSVLPETTAPYYEFNYLDIGSVGTGILTQKPQRLQFGDAPSRARRIVRKGDTVLSTVRTYLKAVYFVAEDTKDLICSTGFAVLTPKHEALPEFVSYLVRSNPFTDQVTAESIGIAYPAIAETRLGSFYVVVPPISEQFAIVRFLDQANRRINRLIRIKQKTIKLLEEQKQVIVYRTVTRGLDPSVPLKPSGIEWLGDISEHWNAVRLKYLFREIDSRSVTGTEVLLSLRMYRGLVPHNEVSKAPISSKALIGFKQVAPGQLVMNRMRASIGLFGVAQQPGLVSPDYAVFEPIGQVDQNYYLHLFKTRAAGAIFRMESKGLGTGSSGFMRLYTDRFGIIKVPLPPVSEQRQIVQGIAEKTAGLTRTSERIEREISLLREYHIRLISDIVTGKLDVRGVELPELDEADALDASESDETAEAEDTEEDTMEGVDA